jgi:hypothetical protein
MLILRLLETLRCFLTVRSSSLHLESFLPKLPSRCQSRLSRFSSCGYFWESDERTQYNSRIFLLWFKLSSVSFPTTRIIFLVSQQDTFSSRILFYVQNRYFQTDDGLYCNTSFPIGQSASQMLIVKPFFCLHPWFLTWISPFDTSLAPSPETPTVREWRSLSFRRTN